MNDSRMETLRTFYRLFYNERRFDEAARAVSASFVNHHPGANGRGPGGMIDDFSRIGPPPSFRIEPLRMFADGDLVWVLAHATGIDPGGVAVDVWRFDEAGAIAEHWDVFRRFEPTEDPSGFFTGLCMRSR